jgi:hypothetical protein
MARSFEENKAALQGLAGLADLVQSSNIELRKDKTTSRADETRFAGDRTVKELLIPWIERERGPKDPEYYERDKQQWEEYSAGVRKHIQEASKSPEVRRKIKQGIPIEDNEDLHMLLESRGYHNELERRNIIKNRNKELLHTVNYGVPHAAADETLAGGVLHHSGFKPVEVGNESNPMATDLRFHLKSNNTPQMVDAQRRMNKRGLALDIVQSRGIMDYILANPNMPLEEVIKRQLDAGMYMKEGKLLHSQDTTINPIQSKLFREGGYDTVKDYIISSNRPKEIKATKSRHGTYDPSLPSSGWDLYDLHAARDIILPQSYNQLMQPINPAYPDRGSIGALELSPKGMLQVIISDEMLHRNLTDPNNRLDQEVIKEFTKQEPKRGGVVVQRRR